MTTQSSALQIEISIVSGATYTRSQFPLHITFVNPGNEPVRLLDCFEPLPVFFSVHLVKAEGTPVEMPGMGKIDFGPKPLEYIELRAGGATTIKVNLAGLITELLPGGSYRLSVQYHNQYGENCFQGTLHSNVIPFQLVAEAQVRDLRIEPLKPLLPGVRE